MISQNIETLEKKVNELGEITGFKKTINEHSKLTKDLEKYKSQLEDYEVGVQTIINKFDESDDNNKKDKIDDIIYSKYVEALQSYKTQFEKTDKLEDKIKLFEDSIDKLKKCDDYLKSRKMEIEYID